jgi:hypothetical protein
MLDGHFWLAFFQFATTVSLAAIGYLSLRHKASIENVLRLEGHVSSLSERIVNVESSLAKCHADRERLMEEKLRTAEELARTKISLAAKEAAMALGIRADAKAAKDAAIENNVQLKENTELTKQTSEAVQALAEKVNSLDSSAIRREN